MNNKTPLSIVLLFAIIFTYLFFKESFGLNLLFADSAFLIWLLISRQLKVKENLQLITATGFLLTGIFTVITHSVFSYLANFMATFIFIGVLIYPEAKSLIHSAALSFLNSFNSQFRFLRELSNSRFIGKRIGKYIYKARILFFPLIIIFFFLIFYRVSNPIFDSIIQSFQNFVGDKFYIFFKNFNIQLIITFIFFVFVSNYLLLRTSNKEITDLDNKSDDNLHRRKRSGSRIFQLSALRTEYKAAIFLFFVLNLILLVLNATDIYWVWFKFEWEGEYLKQFVHEGTYILILSILISIGIVLYFFRANINFYTKNSLLKKLCYAWIIQNAILTISVGIRNIHYIEHFNLAYKRIGVIIFLILTLYGLFTVIIKVRNKQSSFYIIRKNALALYFVLIISSLFNWDNIIARYNFAHADKSFLHLDYLVGFSYKSLPYLDKPLHALQQIDSTQKSLFPFEESYMKPERYFERIQIKKQSFKIIWEEKSFLSWNFPEYQAYRKLFIEPN